MSKLQSLPFNDYRLPSKQPLKLALFLFGSKIGINVTFTLPGHFSAPFDVKVATVSTNSIRVI